MGGVRVPGGCEEAMGWEAQGGFHSGVISGGSWNRKPVLRGRSVVRLQEHQFGLQAVWVDAERL